MKNVPRYNTAKKEHHKDPHKVPLTASTHNSLLPISLLANSPPLHSTPNPPQAPRSIPKPQFLPTKHWRSPIQFARVNFPPSFSLLPLVLFDQSLRQDEVVLTFGEFEQLKNLAAVFVQEKLVSRKRVGEAGGNTYVCMISL